MKSKVTTGVAALFVATLLLSGCAQVPGTSASAIQAKAFPEVYAQTINWEECDEAHSLSDDLAERLDSRGIATDSFKCAMIEAPLDWNDSKSQETIDLAVVHIPSLGKGEPIGTLTGNPGGPGASGLQYMYGMTVSAGFDAVREKYDLLGFDPRGIGRSTPVECPDASGIFEIEIALCAEENPLALSMGTSQVARDMELLRTLMGEDKLDYLGYSYGTILGATYSTLFPERVGRVVLDSAPDHTWASPVGHFTQSVAFTNEIIALLEGCEAIDAVTSCPISGETALEAKIDELDAQPFTASDGTVVNGGLVYEYLMSGLYGGNVGRVEVLDTFGRALAGEQEQIDDLAAAMAGGGASVGMAGMLVSCHSFPEDPDILGLLETITEQGMPRLLGGPDITDSNLQQFVSLGCAALPNSGGDITDRFTAPKDAPLLVIGITGDHATPYENGRSLAKQLGNTRFVTLEGHGHGASFTDRSTCIDDVTAEFLLEGKLPKDGLVCQTD